MMQPEAPLLFAIAFSYIKYIFYLTNKFIYNKKGDRHVWKYNRRM